MNFIDYKNYLIKNNINLFDYDYRTSYKNAIILNENLNQQEQIGGGDTFYMSPFTMIKRSNEKNDKKKLSLLINKLTNGNLTAAKYLCKSNLVFNFIK